MFVQGARQAFAAAEDGERSPALKLDGVEKMDLPNGQSGITTTAAIVSEVRPRPHHTSTSSLLHTILFATRAIFLCVSSFGWIYLDVLLLRCFFFFF